MRTIRLLRLVRIRVHPLSTAGHHVFGLLMINCSGANPVSARNEARRVTRAERPLGARPVASNENGGSALEGESGTVKLTVKKVTIFSLLNSKLTINRALLPALNGRGG